MVALAGWLNLRRDDDGHHVIWADASELRRLRQLHTLPRTWANKKRCSETEEAKTATGAVNSPWPGRRLIGPP